MCIYINAKYWPEYSFNGKFWSKELEFKDISNNKEFEDMYGIFTVFLKSIALQNKNIAL